MAALGAAAGAFEGDRAREQERMRRAQLSQQGAMFNANMKQRQSEGERQQANHDSFVALREKELADRQEKELAEAALREKELADRQEKESYERGRSERKDAWGEALSAQELEKRELEAQKYRVEYENMMRLRKQGEEARANKTKLVDSVSGHIVREVVEYGAASPETLAAFYKATGMNADQAYPGGDGSVIFRVNKGVDPQTNQPIFEEKPIAPQIVAATMERYRDPTDPTDKSVSGEPSRLFQKQDQAAAFEHAQKIAETRSSGRGAQNAPIMDAKIKVYQKRLVDAYAGLDAARTSKEKKRFQSLIAEIEGEYAALNGGETVGETEESSPVAQIMRGGAKGGEYGPVETRTLRKDGSKVHVRRRPDGKYEIVK